MADLTELEALKASMRGALHTAESLRALAPAVEGIDPRADVSDADLDNLQRLSLANALAAQALRGFVESMLRRRGKVTAPIVEGSGGIDE